MTTISKEEVLKIAGMSALSIHEDEIDILVTQLESVLSYAERVREVAHGVEEVSNKQVNVLREDIVIKTDPQPIMAQAVETESNLFVVPAILDGK